MVNDSDEKNTAYVSGTMFQAFVNAGESLKLLIWGSPDKVENFDPEVWYPITKFQCLLDLTSRYKKPGRILEEFGIEMTKFWYNHGPGRDIIYNSIDFIHYQTGAGGFRSVIKGPDTLVGKFELVSLNEEKGFARVHSTTLFPREMELGILYGGLGLVDDLLFYDITFDKNNDFFDIFFVTEYNRTTVDRLSGDCQEISDWKLKHVVNQSRRKEKFWECINETLNAAFIEMKDAMDKAKVLRGLLPICASCKKIRDDRGYWTQLEHYISLHSEADFSHGLCPDCAKRLYPWYNMNGIN